MRYVRYLMAACFGAVVLLATGFALSTVFYGVALIAGDTSTTIDLDAAMKIVFDDTITDSAVTDTELLDILEEGGGIKVDQTTGGRYIELANLFALNGGVGARGEGDYIPIPEGPTIVNGRVNLKKIMGTVDMTAETMKRVKGSMEAFLNWGEQALGRLVDRLTNEMDRMAIGYGSAIKARVNAAAPATDLVIDSAFGISWADNAVIQFLENETLRASPNANGSAPRVGVMKVLALLFDAVTPMVRVDQLATALADNDFLFPGDANGISAGKEHMGLFGMIDDGTVLNVFQNINRTQWPRYRAFVRDLDNGGVPIPLTEEVLDEVDDEAFTRGGAKVETIVGSRYGLRQIWKDLKSDRTINDPRGVYTGGKSKIFQIFGGRVVEIKVARKFPTRVLFGITRSTLRKWFLHAWEWDSTPGSRWRQVVDSTGVKDAFFTYGSTYLECGCSDPQKNWRVQRFA